MDGRVEVLTSVSVSNVAELSVAMEQVYWVLFMTLYWVKN